jgi:sensor c-di-GMP phosphodiesterase-like protein
MEETLGNLDSRLLKLEERNIWEKWEQWFGKHPGIVLGGIIAAIVTAAWVYHTWTIERIDKKHKDELVTLDKRAEDKVNWLKEQHKQYLSTHKDKCELEKSKVASKLEQCKSEKNITSKATGSSEAAPVL